MEIITRKNYADKVDAWIGKGTIIAIVGQQEMVCNIVDDAS